MASSARVEFSAKLRTAVVAKASALLTSVRRTSMHPPELLSVRQAWSKIDHSSCAGSAEGSTNPRSGHSPEVGPRRGPGPMLRPTPTAATGWTTVVGVVATGVAATMLVAVVTVGMATPTTAEEERGRRRRPAWWR